MTGSERVQEARRWLQFALEDLAAAETLAAAATSPDRFVCWHCQQAAEKSLKAVLIFLGLPAPRTHDLDTLLDMVPRDWAMRQEHAELGELTEWAFEARYPGKQPALTRAEARRGLRQARAVLEAVTRDLRSHGLPEGETA